MKKLLFLLLLFPSLGWGGYAKNGRLFDDGNGKKTFKTLLGEHNVDVGNGEFAPYVWDGSVLKFADCELRVTTSSFDLWQSGVKLGELTIEQESKDGLNWGRKEASRGQIFTRQISSGSREELELNFILTSPEQETTIFVKAGGFGKIKFGFKVKATKAGDHRVSLNFGRAGELKQNLDREGKPLPSTYVDYGDFVLSWEPNESADHKFENGKILIAEKTYARGEERLVYPDIITPTLNADADDGNQYNGTQWNTTGFVGMDFIDLDTHPGFSFVFPGTLSATATVEKMYFRAFAEDDEPPSGTCVFKLLTENADPDTNTAWSASHLPTGGSWVTTHADKSFVFSGATWYFGEGDADATNLASDLQSLLSTYGDINSGDRVNFALLHQSGGYVGLQDFSHSSSEEAELSITYSEGGAAPAVAPQRRGFWIRR